MAGEHRIILFSGHVQGVGFRMTAVELARDLALGGTVRNLDDGRVELVVEGTGTAIDELLRRLREHFGAFIRNINETTGTSSGLAKGLKIIY